jgi:hypothetical protein
MILLANHQLRFGKSHNPCDNMPKMTIAIGKMLAKKKIKKFFLFFCNLNYQSHLGVMLG